CGSLAYDPVRNEVVLFGGQTPAFQPPITVLSDTWEWDGSNWEQRTPAISPPGGCGRLAFDPRRGHIMRFDNNALWEWDGNEWSKTSPERTPPARPRAAIAYDPNSASAMMFGGEVVPGFGSVELGDTWL